MDRGVLHGQFTAKVSIDPLHHRILIGEGTLGDQVVDVVGPVLNGCVATASVLLHNDFHHRTVQRFTGVHRSGAAFDVVNLSSFVDDDQRSFELTHIFFIDAEVRLKWVIDLHARRNVDE